MGIECSQDWFVVKSRLRSPRFMLPGQCRRSVVKKTFPRKVRGTADPSTVSPTASRGRRDGLAAHRSARRAKEPFVSFASLHAKENNGRGPPHLGELGNPGTLGVCDFFIFRVVCGRRLRRASANKHRRGPSTPRYEPSVCDGSAKRCAQDDGFVRDLKYS